MSKQTKLHLVYTLQIKAGATRQAGEPQVDDLIDSIKGTLDSWFPKGEVQLERHDVANGEKRVVITNVLPAVQPRRSAGKSGADEKHTRDMAEAAKLESHNNGRQYGDEALPNHE